MASGSKPNSGNRQIKLPTRTKSATIKKGGTQPGSKYGAGYSKGKK